MICVICEAEFTPSIKQARNIKSGGRPFCSRSCSNRGRIVISTAEAEAQRQRLLESRHKMDAIRDAENARHGDIIKTLNSVLLTFGRRAE